MTQRLLDAAGIAHGRGDDVETNVVKEEKR